MALRWLLVLGFTTASCAVTADAPGGAPADAASADTAVSDAVSAADAVSATDSVADSAADSPTDPAAHSDTFADTGPAIAWCTGTTVYAYDPVAGKALETFPDDYYTTADSKQLTGRRVTMDAAHAPWIAGIPGSYGSVFSELSTLDGFGTMAGVIVRFTAPIAALPSGEVDSVQSPSVRFVDVLTGARVPYEAEVTDEGTTAILWPMVPLHPKRRYGVIVTTGAKDAAGACIAPSPTLRALLTGDVTDARLSPLVSRYAELLQVTKLMPGDMSAAVVFTTQSIEETSVAVTADIQKRTYTWKTAPTCTVEAKVRRCEGTFTAWDYRGPDQVVVEPVKAVTAYDLPVRLWLPLQGGPFPVMLFGHGLGGDKDQGAPLAEAAAPLGIATVAIDAVAHGAHPAGTEKDKLLRILGFFGVDVVTQSLKGRVLRDNWRQSTYDKLQLVRLLAGTAELDASRLGYFGVSLGGIMGPELLALTDRFGAAILSVPGGRVSTIIRDAAQFAVVIAVMKPPDAGDGDVRRFFPVLQTLIERGDASNYGRFVLGERLPGTGTAHPQLLVNLAKDDDTVPPACNWSIARALGVPHVPPVVESVGIIPLTEVAPVLGNRDAGKVTAGLFQYDRISKSDASVAKAEHGNVAKSPEGIAQTTAFLKAWLETGVATIVDPYATLGTPKL